MEIKTVLIIDDLEGNRNSLKRVLRTFFHNFLMASHGAEALEKLNGNLNVDLIILDLHMPVMGGIEFLKKYATHETQSPIIVCSGQNEISLAVEAMRLGAKDYLEKPYSNDIIISKVQQILNYSELEKQNQALKTSLDKQTKSHVFFQSSPSLASLNSKIVKLSTIKSSLLITGETGTGKGLIAKQIHQIGPNNELPFIVVDCASLSSNVIESELFGYVKGAFTGATTNKKGLLEAAQHGTLFLDEIGELPLELQGRFLRALQEKQYRPIGANEYKPLKARVIAATNRNLLEEVEAGNFREDLYYRLNIISIRMPSLKERLDDLPYLIEYFLRKHNDSYFVSTQTLSILQQYHWPGNIRELENKIEGAVALADHEEITEEDFFQNEAFVPQNETPSESSQHSVPMITIQDFEKQAIIQALEYTSGNKRKTAEIVGIGEATLYRKIKEYQISL